MAATIRAYDPVADAAEALRLWERTLGASYPVTPRGFLPRVAGHPGWEPGDTWVAEEDGRMLGLALGEVWRRAHGVEELGYISALLVDPACQRRGLGSRMLATVEERLRQAGCRRIAVAGNPNRFWTALPEDLPAAHAFFQKHGYAVTGSSPDMIIPGEGCVLDEKNRQRLADAGVVVVTATTRDAGAVLEFEAREFSGWCVNFLTLFAAGDEENVLLVKHGGEIVGTITAFTPRSRWRSANLVWERIHGAEMGGYGAVGIAAAWRGKGLGGAMSQAAAAHVRSRGASCCYIDWVGPEGFYAKLGAKVWRRFTRMEKTLRPSSGGAVG
jgi:GNAT superfamily N-acetyltransferase